MEETAYMFTLQVQLDSCMDSLLKRTTAEITALVKDKFSPNKDNVVSKETEKRLASANPNYPESQLGKSKAEKTPVIFGEPETGDRQSDTEILLEFQTQLTSCMDCLLKQAMVEIIAWVKDTVVQFHEKIAAKEAEIRHLAEQLHVLETQTQVTLKAVSFGSPDDRPSESPAVFEEIERIDNDAVGLEQESGAAVVRNVPEAACFVEAEPAVDYELTVATTALDGGSLCGDDPRAGPRTQERGGGAGDLPLLRRALGGRGRRRGGAPSAAQGPSVAPAQPQRREAVLLRGLRAAIHPPGVRQEAPAAAHRREAARLPSVPQTLLPLRRSPEPPAHARGPPQAPAATARPRPKLCMCAHCGKAYASAGQLANHERTHTGERPYECGQCHKRFGQAAALSLHRVTHQRERPHACPSCPKSFRCARHLRRHARTHSDARPFACGQCPLCFRSAGELRAHTLRHGLRRSHPCPDCGKRFKTEYEVKLHARAHSGERPYPCPDCPRAFRRLHHLTSHRLTHTGQRPLRLRPVPAPLPAGEGAAYPPAPRAPRPRPAAPLRPLPAQLRQPAPAAGAPARPPRPRPHRPQASARPAEVPQDSASAGGAERGGQQRVGAAAGPGPRGGKVLGPVVFLLAGQGVSIPVLASSTVVTPMTTVAKVPIMPVSRAVSKTRRKAPAPDATPAAKGGRKADTRPSPKPPNDAPTQPAAKTPPLGGAKAAAETGLKIATRSSAKSALPGTPAATPPRTPRARRAPRPPPDSSHPWSPKPRGLCSQSRDGQHRLPQREHSSVLAFVRSEQSAGPYKWTSVTPTTFFMSSVQSKELNLCASVLERSPAAQTCPLTKPAFKMWA
ncbi:hypothetical protein ANANG_G00147270 [Anguilla anguilla]|uniref:C2H2-type domain-containing protein n=1 Tax=Anguilla anguilla TaxID=7936 RepID=A0A9D3MC06_ANGAN|nr:hypothetical protein ANANG_G00147270 [Anguilla anguilla]